MDDHDINSGKKMFSEHHDELVAYICQRCGIDEEEAKVRVYIIYARAVRYMRNEARDPVLDHKKLLFKIVDSDCSQ